LGPISYINEFPNIFFITRWSDKEKLQTQETVETLAEKWSNFLEADLSTIQQMQYNDEVLILFMVVDGVMTPTTQIKWKRLQGEFIEVDDADADAETRPYRPYDADAETRPYRPYEH
jgi:hypothetical protein